MDLKEKILELFPGKDDQTKEKLPIVMELVTVLEKHELTYSEAMYWVNGLKEWLEEIVACKMKQAKSDIDKFPVRMDDLLVPLIEKDKE